MAFVFNPFTGNFDIADTVTFSPPAVDLSDYEKIDDSEARDKDLQDQIDALVKSLPDVYDGTLSIKDADGNELGTFTANQASGSVITLPASPEVNDGKLSIKDSEGNLLGSFTANQKTSTEIVIPAAADDSNPGCVPELLEHKPFDNAQLNGVNAGEFYAVTDNGHPGETKVLVSEEFMGLQDGDSIWIECEEYTPDHYAKTDRPTSKYVQFYVPGDPDQFPPIGETVAVSDCDPGCQESGPQMVFYGAAPPDKAENGALFTDEDSLKQFVHLGDGVWVEVTGCNGGESNSALLSAVKFTGYQTKVYMGTPHSDRTIFSEVHWETMQGIHFEDEITVEVDMNHTDTWVDAHEMTDDELLANDIGIRFNKVTGGLAFNFDWKSTNDGWAAA